jgi:toxin ParE1/3/4
MRRIADDPSGHLTVARADLLPNVRSFHIRHARSEAAQARVANPVHVIFYRAIEPDVVEIVRVLHERMEPSRHIGGSS